MNIDNRFEIDEVGEVKRQFHVRGFEKDTDDLVIQYLFDTVEEVTEFLIEKEKDNDSI